jgi:hypothetical protein
MIRPGLDSYERWAGWPIDSRALPLEARATWGRAARGGQSTQSLRPPGRALGPAVDASAFRETTRASTGRA